MTKHTLNGSDNSDTVVIGSASWDASDDYVIRTYGGNDKVELHVDGTSWVDLGLGNDSLTVNGSGTATVYGGDGNDDLRHEASDYDDGVAKLHGGNGNDSLHGLTGAADYLYGDAGYDYLYVEKGNHAYGGAGDDVYRVWDDAITDPADLAITEYANEGYDIIEANFSKYTFGANIEEYQTYFGIKVNITGNDQANKVVTRGMYNDYFDMKGGDDIVNAAGGNDTVWGGDGNDSINGSDGADIIYGGLGNDNLSGGAYYEVVSGSQDDYIYGGDGNDVINGGVGSDRLHGDAGDDIISAVMGTPDMFGGTGNDTFVVEGMGTTIIEYANEGIDTIQLYGPSYVMSDNVENLMHVGNPRGTSVDYVGATEVTGNALANIISGNNHVNTIDGMAGADVIYGQGGNDVLRGGEGNDGIYGDSDNDLVYGDAGNDSLFGGDGTDSAYGGEGNDAIYGGDGTDSAYGGEGNDAIYGGAGDDYLIGEAGNDTIWGGTEDDYVNGGAGYDTVYGEDGNDVVRGGGNTDYLYGGAGADRIYGDAGGDQLYGGEGQDTFVFATLNDSNIATGIDQLRDFAADDDFIDVTAIDANTSLSGNQAFTWGGAHAPGAGHAGTLWTEAFAATNYNAQFVRVYGDVNGDGTADFQIDVMNVTSLSAGDFQF